jgi:hypothetical protein
MMNERQQLFKSVIDKIENNYNYLNGRHLQQYSWSFVTLLNDTYKENYG